MYIELPKTDLVGCKFYKCSGRNCRPEVDPFSKEYVYKVVPGIEELRLGDMVVVSSINGFGVCMVTSLNRELPASLKGDVACVVGKVDYTRYEEALERDQQKKQLKSALLRRRKELDDELSLEFYADKDAEFKKLLEAYKSL